MPDTHTNHKAKITLNPACHVHGKRDRARQVWGQGLMSGLPFAELVLLAGFLLCAGLLLGLGDGNATHAPATPVHDVQKP